MLMLLVLLPLVLAVSCPSLGRLAPARPGLAKNLAELSFRLCRCSQASSTRSIPLPDPFVRSSTTYYFVDVDVDVRRQTLA